jgi:DNA modification methylase
MSVELILGDCLEVMKSIPDKSNGMETYLSLGI